MQRLLVDDHSLARMVASELDDVARIAEAGLPLPARRVLLVIRFFHDFFEGRHHRFENDLLYPAVLEQGSADEVRAAGRLAAAHDETKLLLRMLTLAWEPSGVVAQDEREAFSDLARAFAKRLRKHMEIEELLMFRFAHAPVQPDARACAAHAAERDAWRTRILRARSHA